jgi:hypothetical protein
MAILPVATLRAKYLELSTAFIEEVNTGSIVLSYPEVTTPTANSNNFSQEPSVIDSYGGRQPLYTLTDRNDEGGTNLHVVPQTETIPARVYWQNIKFGQQGAVIDTKDYAKTITYASNTTKILNATFATIDGRRVKVSHPPVPYGLFGKQWCVTYWETI